MYYKVAQQNEMIHYHGTIKPVNNDKSYSRNDSAKNETAILKRSNTRGGIKFRRVISKYII